MKLTHPAMPRHRTITCEVIAAQRDLFDIRTVVLTGLHVTLHIHRGESHAELSNSYHRLGARELKAGAPTAAASVWCDTQHRCRHRKFTETHQLSRGRVSAGPQQQPH